MYCDLDVDDEGKSWLYFSWTVISLNNEDESYHVCHKGYLSLFPFLLELLSPDSPHLGHILDLLYDPAHLWSPYGIRSLSASHPEFGKGENYWKGPIWIQMNYLALKALHKVTVVSKSKRTNDAHGHLQTYAAKPGPYQAKAQQIYKELRRNVVDNVAKVSIVLSMELRNVLLIMLFRNMNALDMYGSSMTQLQARANEGPYPLLRHFNCALSPCLQSSIYWMDVIDSIK
jgi:hypothetical protein